VSWRTSSGIAEAGTAIRIAIDALIAAVVRYLIPVVALLGGPIDHAVSAHGRVASSRPMTGVTRFNGALRAAAVAGHGVQIVALFGRAERSAAACARSGRSEVDEAVAARGLVAGRTGCRAEPAALCHALAAAAIAGRLIRIIALFEIVGSVRTGAGHARATARARCAAHARRIQNEPIVSNAITAGRLVAGHTWVGANPARFELTGGAATVARDWVPVVALFGVIVC